MVVRRGLVPGYAALGLLLFSCASGPGSAPQTGSPADGVSGLVEDTPLVSPDNPKTQREIDPEMLLPPWDPESAALVNEKPRVSPRAVLPPQVPKNGEIPLEKPLFTPPAPAQTGVPAAVPVPAAASGAKPAPAEAPAQPGADQAVPAPRPAARTPFPRASSPPASFMTPLPEPDLSARTPAVFTPEVEYEDVTARPGDEVYFQFSPQGWVFTDKDRVGQSAGYRSTDLKDPQRTVFLFVPPQAGTFSLEFRRSDLATGTVRLKKVTLKVIPPGEEMVDRQVVKTEAVPVLTKGEQLERSGKWEEALDLYLSNYDSGSPLMNWRIGNLYLRLGDRNQAMDYWKKNLESQGTWSQSSWLEVFSQDLKDRRTEEALYWAEWGRERDYRLPEDLHLRLADQLGGQGLLKEALFWLEEYGRNYPGSRKADTALFLKAQILEREGPQRNIREALRSYRILQQDYPLSPWWPKAVERAGELERQFLRIR